MVMTLVVAIKNIAKSTNAQASSAELTAPQKTAKPHTKQKAKRIFLLLVIKNRLQSPY